MSLSRSSWHDCPYTRLGYISSASLVSLIVRMQSLAIVYVSFFWPRKKKQKEKKSIKITSFRIRINLQRLCSQLSSEGSHDAFYIQDHKLFHVTTYVAVLFICKYNTAINNLNQSNLLRVSFNWLHYSQAMNTEECFAWFFRWNLVIMGIHSQEADGKLGCGAKWWPVFYVCDGYRVSASRRLGSSADRAGYSL